MPISSNQDIEISALYGEMHITALYDAKYAPKVCSARQSCTIEGGVAIASPPASRYWAGAPKRTGSQALMRHRSALLDAGECFHWTGRPGRLSATYSP